MKQNTPRSASEELSDHERRRLIHEQPAALGTAWAISACEELMHSGRRIEGGFPGTVPEARSRVQRELSRLLAKHGLPPLQPNELVAATSATYEQAKREWHVAGRIRAGKPPAVDTTTSAPSDGRKNT